MSVKHRHKQKAKELTNSEMSELEKTIPYPDGRKRTKKPFSIPKVKKRLKRPYRHLNV
jgi:hypothetical protein